ncbi:MAG: RNA-binding protein [Alphaproteobacteria bacterium]|jgi:predicted RNA-binding protein YlxR (DUF448 family)
MQAYVQQRTDDAETVDMPSTDSDGLRRCIVSGESLPRAQLLRFVVGPDDIVVPDLAERLPGRGLWLQARRDIVAEACVRNRFSRAARCKVTPMAGPAGEPLDAVVEAQLVRRCIDVLSLARRAGATVGGFDQVRQWLRARPPRCDSGETAGPALLLAARDAAPGGREKLEALARWDDGVAVPVATCALMKGEELGQAFGRDHLVHVLVTPHRLAGRLMAETGRLAGFRDEGDEGTESRTAATAEAAAGAADRSD